MEEFLNKLYSYDNFSLYLIIAIIVLIILFIIILFCGKKDKLKREIETTKKLQKLDEEAFKEEDNSQKVDIAVENNALNNNINPDDFPVINNVEDNNIPEPVLPINEAANVNVNMDEPTVMLTKSDIQEELNKQQVVNEIKEEKVEPMVEEVSNNISEDVKAEPFLEKVSEKPLVFAEEKEEIINTPKIEDIPKVEEIKKEEVVDVPVFNFEDISKDFSELNEEPKEEIKEEEVKNGVLEVPAFNFEDISKDFNDLKEQPKEEIKEPVVPETKIEEAPKEVAEKPFFQNKEVFSSVFVSNKEEKNEEEEFELPSLKKEVVEKENVVASKPTLHDYSLDSLVGETYTIEK